MLLSTTEFVPDENGPLVMSHPRHLQLVGKPVKYIEKRYRVSKTPALVAFAIKPALLPVKAVISLKKGAARVILGTLATKGQ